jgi:hypothetical protein
MPRKQKIFVGTDARIAKTMSAAQKDFDKGCEHVIEEDGNPYHSMLDWKESKDHDICPECGDPNHKRDGHWCCPKQAHAGGNPERGKASPKAIANVDRAIGQFLVCLKNRNDKHAILDAWNEVKAAATS